MWEARERPVLGARARTKEADSGWLGNKSSRSQSLGNKSSGSDLKREHYGYGSEEIRDWMKPFTVYPSNKTTRLSSTGRARMATLKDKAGSMSDLSWMGAPRTPEDDDDDDGSKGEHDAAAKAGKEATEKATKDLVHCVPKSLPVERLQRPPPHARAKVSGKATAKAELRL